LDRVTEEVCLKGAPVSEGIAIGALFLLEETTEETLVEFSISGEEVEGEVTRYRSAIHSSREDLTNLHSFLAKEGSEEAASIIDSHIHMLEDPFLTTFMETRIRQMRKNTESVFQSVMGEYEREFSKVSDDHFQARLLDIKDLSKRIMNNLNFKHSIPLREIPNRSIIFAREITPSSIAEASGPEVSGFVTEIGGATSHAALIARSQGIPYVTNIDISLVQSAQQGVAIIDGNKGIVILNPKPETLEKYLKLLELQGNKVESGAGEARTTDGIAIQLLTNSEKLEELDEIKGIEISGVGLFRTEFLFLEREISSVTEEEQYTLYKEAIDRAKGMPITFRVFDVGGDKGKIDLPEPEANPALGCRAIRYLLKRPEIFKRQLRALLRLSVDGRVRILLPLISDIEEVIQSKKLITEVALELSQQGVPIPDTIPIGCMIEVPSAVMMCDLIAEESDFLSIGTNDLLQYNLAVDRMNQASYAYSRCSHPSLIRMIRRVIEECSKRDTPVSVCGEMASDPLMIPLLVGMGIRRLSCAARHLPGVRERISTLSLSACEKKADEVLKLKTAQEIEAALADITPEY